MQRHIIQQQIQGFTQEEGSPLCSSENEEKYFSSDDKSVLQTDYVLAKIGSSSDDDDEEGDEYSHHSDNYYIWEESYSLFALNSSVSFIKLY